MTETFTQDVLIDGSSDATQLKVQGHTTQTNPLQQWQTGDTIPVPLARLTGDGRLQVGSFEAGEMATDDALIEAHRADTDTSKPTRGLHLKGGITGALTSVVSWIVYELSLKGTQGMAALQTALRVRLRNEATGTMTSSGELRGADVEVTNAGGTSGSRVLNTIGMRVGVANEATGYLDKAYGLKVEMTNAGASTQINQQYALYTDAGINHLGDVLEIPVLGAAPSGNPPANFVKTYVKLSEGQPQLYSKDSAGVERVLGGSGGGGTSTPCLYVDFVVSDGDLYPATADWAQYDAVNGYWKPGSAYQSRLYVALSGFSGDIQRMTLHMTKNNANSSDTSLNRFRLREGTNTLYSETFENDPTTGDYDIVIEPPSPITSATYFDFRLQTAQGNTPVQLFLRGITVEGENLSFNSEFLDCTPSGSDDYTVKVSSDDTTPGYVEDKFTVSGGLTKTTTSAGANEKLDIGLPDNAITTTKLATNAVTTPKIADDAVTNAKIATDAVNADSIAAGAVGSSELASNAVTTAKLTDDAVTLAKLAHGTANRYIGFDATGVPVEKDGGGSGGKLYRSPNGLQLLRKSVSELIIGGGEMVVGDALIAKTVPTVLDLATAGNWIGGSSLESNSEYVKVYMNDAGNIKLSDKMPNYPRATTDARVATGQINGSPGLNGTSVVYDNDTDEGSITPGMLLVVYTDSARTQGRGRGSGAGGSVDYVSTALITAINTSTNTITLEAGHQINLTDNDYWSVIEYAPLEYYYDGTTFWRLIDMMYNDASGNLDGSKIGARAKHLMKNEASNYTTNSTTFVDIDSTKLNLILYSNGADVFIGFLGSAYCPNLFYFDIKVDDVRFGDSEGAALAYSDGYTAYHFNICVPVMLPGTHTFKLQWRVLYGTTTATLLTGSGSGSTDVSGEFWVRQDR